MSKYTQEICIAKNENGKIIKTIDMFGNVKYILLDSNNNYQKDICPPFRISDYLENKKKGWQIKQ